MRSGHLALRRAKDGTGIAVGAVVEFFAPIFSLPGGLGDDIGDLPPVQIHHGDSDHVVAKTESAKLAVLLNTAGKVQGVDYEYHTYAGEGHGFRGVTAVELSRRLPADFFKQHLG